MKEISLSLLVSLLIFCMSVLEVGGAIKDNGCDFSTPTLSPMEATNKLQSLVQTYWNQPMSSTELGAHFINEVKLLALSGNADCLNLAVTITVLSNAFIPYASQKPDVCAFAAVIDGAVALVINNDPTELLAALPLFVSKADEMLYRVVYIIFLNSGCNVKCETLPPDPIVSPSSCTHNGFVYDVTQFWNTPGPPYSNIPASIKNFIVSLYNSKDYTDKLLAAVATLSMARDVFDSMMAFPCNFKVLILELLTIKTMKTECCFPLYEKLNELSEYFSRFSMTHLDRILNKLISMLKE